jgi:HlyD family secretion protein
MSWNRIILIIFIVLVVGAGGYFLLGQDDEAGAATAVPQVNTIAVDTGVETISGEGQIVPLRHAELAFEVGGQVMAVLVQEGQIVQPGDVLARLDSRDAEIAWQQAEAGVVQAQANLQAGEAQVAVAQAGLAAAQLTVAAAQANLAWVQAPPLPEEVAVAELGIEAAAAGITLASGQRNVSLDAATEAQIRAAEAQVAEANAALQTMQEQYDTLIENEILGPPEEDARLQLQIAQANVAAAQARLDELNAGATAAQIRSANAGVTTADGGREAAQAQLDLLLAGATAEQVQQAEIGVQQAETAVTRAELSVAQAEANVGMLQTAVQQAEAVRDAAQDALDHMALTAPFTGTVAHVNIEMGEVAVPGLAIAAIADFSGWLVETTDLTELDIVAVKVGLPVAVRVDALPDELLSGEVVDIAAVSSLSQGDVTYTVTIRLNEGTDLPLRWGMTTFVDVDVK